MDGPAAERDLAVLLAGIPGESVACVTSMHDRDIRLEAIGDHPRSVSTDLFLNGVHTHHAGLARVFPGKPFENTRYYVSADTVVDRAADRGDARLQSDASAS
jgi:hypothetical protein